MSTPMKWILVVVLAGAVWLGVHLAHHRAREWADSDVQLTVDIERIGQVLILFAQDRGRMPTNLEELLRRGYLEPRDDGMLHPGGIVIGRSNPYGDGPEDLPFRNFDRIVIQYEDAAMPGEELVTVPDTTCVKAVRAAEFVCSHLEEVLQPQDRCGTPPTDAIPGE